MGQWVNTKEVGVVVSSNFMNGACQVCALDGTKTCDRMHCGTHNLLRPLDYLNKRLMGETD